MPQKVAFLFIVLLAISLSGCVGKEETGSQVSWATYEDPQGRFSVEYPKEWEVEVKTDGIVFESPSETAWIDITFVPIPPTLEEVDLKALLFSTEGYVKAKYPLNPVSEPQEIKISEYDALKRTYKAEIKGVSITTILAITQIGDISYMFRLDCASSEFSQNEPIFNHMISSFRSPAITLGTKESSQVGTETPTVPGPGPEGTQVSTKLQPTTLTVTEEKQLTKGSPIDERPAWSPDGKKIVFVSYSSGNADISEIWMMDSDGGNKKQLTTRQESADYPSWSPDGRKFVFSSNRSGNYDIWVMDADGGNQKQLTNNPSYDEYPSWSPEGTKIAFVSSRSGKGDIWTMDANGQNEIQLTKATEIDLVYPQSWSPDGKRMAFTSYRSDNAEIWMMDSDGGNKKQLTKDSAWDGRPAWSPDGKRIAFSSDRSGNKDIWIMDSDGSNQKLLITSQDEDNNPSWSPDGKKIVYIRCMDSGCDIWVATLTEAPSEISLPSMQTPPPKKEEPPNLTVIPARSPILSIDYRYVGDTPTIKCDTYPPALLVEEALGAREAVGADAYVKFNNVGGPGKIKIETTFETTYEKVLSSKSSELDIDGNKQYVVRIKIYYRLSEAYTSGRYYLKINSPSRLKVNYEVKSPYGGYDMDLPEIEDITICSEKDL